MYVSFFIEVWQGYYDQMNHSNIDKFIMSGINCSYKIPREISKPQTEQDNEAEYDLQNWFSHRVPEMDAFRYERLDWMVNLLNGQFLDISWILCFSFPLKMLSLGCNLQFRDFHNPLPQSSQKEDILTFQLE